MWPPAHGGCSSGGADSGAISSAVVVGGGLAGLAAAYEIARQGGEVTLLERAGSLAERPAGARQLLGGRVASFAAAFEPSLIVEAGAEFIAGTDEDVIEAAFELSARTGLDVRPVAVRGSDLLYLRTSVAPGGALFRWQGGLRESADAGELSGRLAARAVQQLASGGTLEAVLGPLYEQIEVPIWRTSHPAARQLDAMTLGELLRGPQLDLHPDALRLIEAYFEDENGVSIEDVSALYGLDELFFAMYDQSWSRAPGSGPRGLDPLGFYRIPGGNDRLVQAYDSALRALGARIVTGAEVVAIEQLARGAVRVSTRAGQSFAAAGAVVAVPSWRLRAISFPGGLSAGKRALIAEYPYTSYVKVVFFFERRPWERHCPGGPGACGQAFVTTDLVAGSIAVVHAQDPGSSAAALVVLISGRDAQAFVSLWQSAPQAALAQVRDAVEQLWPGTMSPAAGYRAGEDRVYAYAGTALPYPRPGAVAGQGDVLRLLPHSASRLGRIAFAGDYVDNGAGMTFAIRSARRAVRLLARALA